LKKRRPITITPTTRDVYTEKKNRGLCKELWEGKGVKKKGEIPSKAHWADMEKVLCKRAAW